MGQQQQEFPPLFPVLKKLILAATRLQEVKDIGYVGFGCPNLEEFSASQTPWSRKDTYFRSQLITVLRAPVLKRNMKSTKNRGQLRLPPLTIEEDEGSLSTAEQMKILE